MGGFKCSDCGKTAADLQGMGDPNSGYVSVRRTTYGRERSEGFTREGW